MANPRSVTAGEHGEPAEGEPHIYVRPQGGRTGIRSAKPATAAGRWRAVTRGMPAQDTHTHTRRTFDPLGADDDGGTRLPRVRCAHPRLQSSATPAGHPCGAGSFTECLYRCRHGDGGITATCCRDGDGDGGPADALHRHRHGDRGTTTTCCRDDGRDSVAPAILQRNGDEDGGPKGAELLCNRG